MEYEDAVNVISMLDAGKTEESVASELGISKSSLFYRLRRYRDKYNLKRRKVYRRYTPAAVQFAYKMRLQGMRYRDIQDQLEQVHPECRRLEFDHLRYLVCKYRQKLAENSTRAN